MKQNYFISQLPYEYEISDSDFIITASNWQYFQQKYDPQITKYYHSFIENGQPSTQNIQIYNSLDLKTTYLSLYSNSNFQQQNESIYILSFQQQIYASFQQQHNKKQEQNSIVLLQNLLYSIRKQQIQPQQFFNMKDLQAFDLSYSINNARQEFICQQDFSNPYQENGEQVLQNSKHQIKSLQLYLYLQLSQSIFEKIQIMFKISIIEFKNQNLEVSSKRLKSVQCFLTNLTQKQQKSKLNKINQLSILSWNLLREISIYKLKASQSQEYYKKIEIAYTKLFNPFSLINTKLHKSFRLEVIGKYDQVLQICQECLKMIPNLFSQRNSYLSDIENSIGIIYFRKGKYKQALKKFQRSIQIKGEQFTNQIDKQQFQLYSNLNFGITYFQLKDYQKSKIFFQKVENHLHICFDKNSICSSIVYTYLGNLKNAQCLYKQALSYFQMANQILKNSKQPQQSKINRYISLLTSKAIYFQNIGDNKLAWKTHLQLFQILFFVCNRNKHLLEDTFQFNKCMNICPQQILQVLSKMLISIGQQQVFPFTNSAFFNFIYNVGFFMSRYLKDNENAMKLLKFLEKLRLKYKFTNFPQHAHLLKQIGFIFYMQKLYQLSIQQFKKSLKIYVKIYGQICSQAEKLRQSIYKLKKIIQNKNQIEGLDQQDQFFKASTNALYWYGFLRYNTYK